MKVLLLIMLLDGYAVRLPMLSLEACLQAETLLDPAEVRWTACEMEVAND